MILIAENRGWTTTYPAALEPVALADIAPVGVVVPLDTVQGGCCAISRCRHERREEDEVVVRSSSRVVALQKFDCRSSPKQMNSRTALVSETYSCARKNWDRKARAAQQQRSIVLGCFFSRARTRGVSILCSNRGRRRWRATHEEIVIIISLFVTSNLWNWQINCLVTKTTKTS